jgi:hypothetical protein
MPVLIYERVKTAQHWHFFRRYRLMLLFVGRLNVLEILQFGVSGYWYVMGTEYGASVVNALAGILTATKLDEAMYNVVDWFEKKGRLIIYVAKEIRPTLETVDNPL